MLAPALMLPNWLLILIILRGYGFLNKTFIDCYSMISCEMCEKGTFECEAAKKIALRLAHPDAGIRGISNLSWLNYYRFSAATRTYSTLFRCQIEMCRVNYIIDIAQVIDGYIHINCKLDRFQSTYTEANQSNLLFHRRLHTNPTRI